MARASLYPLFVLLIVFALRLDFNEAAKEKDFPPPGYIKKCLLDAEVEVDNGIYRYDPDESQKKGRPKMVRLKVIPGEPLDYDRVDESYYISYSKVEGKYALRFSMGNLRFGYKVAHPCKLDDTENKSLKRLRKKSLWKIFKDEEGVPFSKKDEGVQSSKDEEGVSLKDEEGVSFKGYVQLTNDLVGFECVSRHGLLTSDIKYKLPAYKYQPTVYGCVTWLKEEEIRTGIRSFATAAQVDPHTKRCTLFYKSHEDFTESSGDNNYCLLEEFVYPDGWVLPAFLTDYPGFYSACLVHVEDPVFAGRWELSFSRSFNYMPYMHLRRAPLGGIFERNTARVSGFVDGYWARLYGNNLQFLKDGAVGLEFKLRAHICIGPDIGKLLRTETAGQISVAYRRDDGMRCVPFYINTNFIQITPNTVTVTLDGRHTAERCQDHMNTNFADRDWKVVTTVHDDGPCYAFERGSEILARIFNVSPNTYSCFY